MILVTSNGDTSDFKIAGNAVEVAREYAQWLINNAESKEVDHKGIIFEEVENEDHDK